MCICICYIYLQMICQKLCQNSVSAWGSLEERSFGFFTTNHPATGVPAFIEPRHISQLLNISHMRDIPRLFIRGCSPLWLIFSSQVFKFKSHLQTLHMVTTNQPLDLRSQPEPNSMKTFLQPLQAFNEAHQRGFLHRSWVKPLVIGLI